MSLYDNQVISSDLDAFKNSGVVLTGSIIINDVIVAAGQLTSEISFNIPDGCDLAQIMYDNSYYHPSKFRDITKNIYTSLRDSTSPGGDGSCYLYTKVQSNKLIVGVWVNNPYSSALTVGPTTYNFILIPYETTF